MEEISDYRRGILCFILDSKCENVFLFKKENGFFQFPEGGLDLIKPINLSIQLVTDKNTLNELHNEKPQDFLNIKVNGQNIRPDQIVQSETCERVVKYRDSKTNEEKITIVPSRKYYVVEIGKNLYRVDIKEDRNKADKSKTELVSDFCILNNRKEIERENYEIGAQREIFEEIGITLRDIKLLVVDDYFIKYEFDANNDNNEFYRKFFEARGQRKQVCYFVLKDNVKFNFLPKDENLRQEFVDYVKVPIKDLTKLDEMGIKVSDRKSMQYDEMINRFVDEKLSEIKNQLI